MVGMIGVMTWAVLGAEPLPRFKPLSPHEAQAAFNVQDGFAVELLASEPLLASPVAVAYDENGRAFVAEMRDYPFADKANDLAYVENTKDPAIGRIRLLEDADGDGVFERSTIFAAGLSWPTGMACYRGGVFVIATPDLWYLKDADGDGVAEIRDKVATGFRKFNIQAVANNLQWGLDHRISGAGGTNGGKIQSLLTPNRSPAVMTAHDFRFDPTHPIVELIPGGARFGQTMNDAGQRFLCNIRNPVIHVVWPDLEVLKRNPFLTTKKLTQDAAAAGDTLTVFRTSPVEPWRQLRADRWSAEGQAIPKSELVGAGYFTSATGITLYRGSAYPKKYRGQAFVADVAGNLVHRQRLTPAGVSYAAERLDANTEFVTSTDTWFRPVNFVNAPDGTLHIVDMYREVIEHPWSIPEDIKDRLDLLAGREKGRLWRLRPPGFQQRPTPKLGGARTADLVGLLTHPNAWQRETAHRLLFERQDPAAPALLRQALSSITDPIGIIHVWWSLEGMQALTLADLTVGMTHSDPAVRELWARLVEPFIIKDEHARLQLLRTDKTLLVDGDPRVDFQRALTMGTLSPTQTIDALSAIASKHVEDEWVRLAVFTALGESSHLLLERLDPAILQSAGGRVLARQLGQMVGAKNSSTEIQAVLQRLPMQSRRWQSEVLLGLGQGLSLKNQRLSTYLGLADAPLGKVFADLLHEAKRQALAADADLVQRETMIETLKLGAFADVRDTLVSLLEPGQPTSLQLTALRTLGSWRESAIVAPILERWRSFTPAARGEAIEVLLARPERIEPLLDALEAKHAPIADIPVTRRSFLQRHSNKLIADRAQKLFGASSGSRKQTLEQFAGALMLSGNASSGQQVYRKICANCHRFGAEGHAVGPALEAARNQSPAQMLVSILDPNREVSPNYLEYLAVLHSGSTVSGILAADAGASITLRRAGGQEDTILRNNLEQLVGTNKSLMPENLDQQLSPQLLADLIAFLKQ